MKKNVLALAATVAVSMPALAQNQASSVTLYGIADAGLVSYSNVAGASRQAVDGYWVASRFGFRGSEDLGNGLNAVFVLENGFNVDTGAAASAASFFNRQSWVGLSSKSLGSLTFGRQYSPSFDHITLAFSAGPSLGTAAGAIYGLSVPGSAGVRFNNTLGAAGNGRVDNSVKYISPTMSGFKVSAMVGLGEDAGGTSSKLTMAAGISHHQGPYGVGLVYHVKNCASSPSTGSCAVTADNDKVTILGGSYDFGPAKVLGTYTNQKNALNVKGNDASTYSVSMQVPLGQWVLAGGYQRLNDETSVNQDIKQYTFAVNYKLSKRTMAYGAYANQTVDNNGIAGMNFQNSSGSKQSLLAVGIMTVF